ncbi:hypothetical protein SLA2020_268400 [Shorea laevis]
MANMVISEMGLPKWIANIFAARNIITGKDALSLTEFELMDEIVCPPYQTALSVGWSSWNRQNTILLKALFIGFSTCKLWRLRWSCNIYDVESKFSSRRMIEIGMKSFPEIFLMKGMAQEMGGRILVLHPTSLSEFTESLQQIKVSLLQHQVKLLVIDSMAALVSGEYDQGAPRQHALGWHVSFIKSLAEFSRIPVVVTNQVRSQSRDEACQYSFQVQSRDETKEDRTRYDSHLVAALGIHWAHAVTIRLVLESKSGQRFIKVAKSPISPPLAFPFNITSSGMSLLSDDGFELTGGADINTIHCQGHNDIIILSGKACSDQSGRKLHW